MAALFSLCVCYCVGSFDTRLLRTGMILNADHDSVLWAASAAVLAQLTICVACGIMCGSKSKKPVTPKSPQAAIVSPVASPAPVVAPVPRKEVKTDNADAKKVSKAKPKEDKPKTKEDKTKTKEDKPKTKEEKKPEKKAEPVNKQGTEEKTAEPKPDSGNRPVPKLIDDGQYANLVEKSKDEKFQSAQERFAKTPKGPKDADAARKKDATGPKTPGAAKSVDNHRKESNAPGQEYENLDNLEEKKPDVKPAAKKSTTPQPKSTQESQPQKTNPNEEDDAFEKKVDRSEMKTEVVPESQRPVEA